MTKKKSIEKTPTGYKDIPSGKKQIAISNEEYDLLRQQIISLIWKHNEIAFTQLLSDLEKNLAGKFSGSLLPHVHQITTDLENLGVTEQVPGKKIQYLRLKQRMEKGNE